MNCLVTYRKVAAQVDDFYYFSLFLYVSEKLGVSYFFFLPGGCGANGLRSSPLSSPGAGIAAEML